MDTTRFIRNFILFKEALQKQNFNNKELNTTSMQAALQSEQLALNEEAQGLQSEQVRAKMQIDFLGMQANLQNAKAETLNKLIQCQAMLKSLKDNAIINRANAFVSLLQVQANAANTITLHNFETAFKIIAMIGNEYDQINLISGRVEVKTKDQTNELKTILDSLSKELEKLNEQSEIDSIQVFSDKLEVLKDAPTRLWGFSTLSNADEGFYNESNELLASGSVCLFRSDKVGKHIITFKASNTKTTLSKNITISVVANKLKERTN
uniref:Phage protein n=1 Tax=Helicobacter pylori TaxID=210 RepID=A0A060CUL0_HELPX|nr:phage protein [Helicobacter pylori]